MSVGGGAWDSVLAALKPKPHVLAALVKCLLRNLGIVVTRQSWTGGMVPPMSLRYENSSLFGYSTHLEQKGSTNIYIHHTATVSTVLNARYELQALDYLGADGWRLVSEKNYDSHISNKFPEAFQQSVVDLFGARVEQKYAMAINIFRLIRQAESTDS